MSDQGLKKAVKIGALAGALVSLGAALSMDILFADALQGTWRDAAIQDITKLFGPAWGQSYTFVTLILVLVMGFISGIGALLGTIAAVFLHKFFNLILK